MWQGLVGVRADRGYSYRKLEKIAAYVRNQLEYSPTEAINTLLLFDGLNIEVRAGTSRDIPIHGSVIELNGSEGFAKYDSDRRVIEILASSETYDWVGEGSPARRFLRCPRAGTLLAAYRPACALGPDPQVATGCAPSRWAGGRTRSLPGHRMAGQRIRRRPAYARPGTRDP